MATIAEIATDIFRINLEIPGAPIDVSFFVIRDEQPTLVETGFRRAFPDTYQAVARVIDPTTLRYVVVPHLEGDESGALNLFLERAPAAVPVGSPIGVATNLSDFAVREPLAVDGDSTLDLGKHHLSFLITPYVHQWDSMLAFDQATRTLFSSDVFITRPAAPRCWTATTATPCSTATGWWASSRPGRTWTPPWTRSRRSRPLRWPATTARSRAARSPRTCGRCASTTSPASPNGTRCASRGAEPQPPRRPTTCCAAIATSRSSCRPTVRCRCAGSVKAARRAFCPAGRFVARRSQFGSRALVRGRR